MTKITYEEAIKELDLYKTDPVKRGFFALQRILNLQIDYLNGFDLATKVSGKASEDATFARTQGMWENLPKMITSLNELKVALKINPADEEANKPARRTTPESIAESIGETAGHKN